MNNFSMTNAKQSRKTDDHVFRCIIYTYLVKTFTKPLFQYRSILDCIQKEPDIKLKKLVLIFSTYNKKFDKLKVTHTNLNASLM